MSVGLVKQNFPDLEIYSSVYEYIDSNMYVLVQNGKALVVDPQKNEGLQEIFEKNYVKKVTILLTHEHADHISGLWWFQERYECTVLCSQKCAELIACKKSTRPLLLAFKIEEEDRKNGTNKLEQFNKDFVWATYKADIAYEKSMHYSWQSHELDFYAINGHSEGSSLVVMDNKYVFTGDSLLKKYPVIVSFPNGSKRTYVDETLPLFEKVLNSDMTILPGHGEPFVLSDIMIDGKIKVEIR